jgi:hypothetical protein
MPRPFEKGNKFGINGCPKGAHHIGRPSSKVKQFAKSRSLRIVKRLAKIADGEDLEQVVTENGDSIKIPSPIREQIKASEIVLKISNDLGPDVEINNHSEGSRLIFVHPESK